MEKWMVVLVAAGFLIPYGTVLAVTGNIHGAEYDKGVLESDCTEQGCEAEFKPSEAGSKRQREAESPVFTCERTGGTISRAALVGRCKDTEKCCAFDGGSWKSGVFGAGLRGIPQRGAAFCQKRLPVRHRQF